MFSFEGMAPDTRFYKARDGRCYAEVAPAEAEAWIDPEGDVAVAPREGFRPMAVVDVGDRVPLGHEDAMGRLAEGAHVHVISHPRPGVFLGAWWDREQVAAFFRLHGAEEAGPRSTAGGYGVASTDGQRWLFFQTGKG